MSTSKLVAGALAAALAVTAQAQIKWPPSEANKRPQPQPAPAPQTQPAPAPPQAQPPAGQVAQLSAEQRAALGTMWAHNQLGIRAGDVAAASGASNEVKNLGRWLANDHRRIEGELAKMLRERGVADPNTLAPPADKQRLESELGQLSARAGEDFDKELVAFLTRNQPMFVEALKRARDVTPGKDAGLKKFLDDVENLEEGHLSASRQLKTQRQARTPPAR